MGTAKQSACKRCGVPTTGKLDNVPICDDCYSVFGACCASEFENTDFMQDCTEESNTGPINLNPKRST